MSLAVGFGMMVLAGCSSTVHTQGYQLEQRRVDQIAAGVTSREEVAQILGSPSSIATFDDRNWYYIAQRYDRANFFQQELVAQDVILVAFDERGIVERVEQRDMQTAMVIEPDPDETKTMGNELTVLEQLLGNVGRFNTLQDNEGGIRGASRSPGGR